MSSQPESPPNRFVADANLMARQRLSGIFSVLCGFATYLAIGILIILLGSVLWTAKDALSLDLIRNTNSVDPEKAGMLSGLWGSFWLITLTAAFAVPIGIGSAVYLEEYARENVFTRFIKVNLSNLAGVPSIVYGILGMTAFVRLFFLLEDPSNTNSKALSLLGGLVRIPIPFGSIILSGALTMALLVLPVVIIAAQEALKAVPSSIRAASYALGATRWQTIRHQVLPAALPGIATGVILAISRAVGETAPLVMIGALTVNRFCPGGVDSPIDLFRDPSAFLRAPFDVFTAMPIEIYHWAKQPGDEFRPVAAAGIVVLLAVLLLFNSVAVLVRQWAGKKVRW